MEGISEMHHTMSHMHHVSSNGIVEQVLGLAGRLSAQLLIVLIQHRSSRSLRPWYLFSQLLFSSDCFWQGERCIPKA
jgi:primosomal protein N''